MQGGVFSCPKETLGALFGVTTIRIGAFVIMNSRTATGRNATRFHRSPTDCTNLSRTSEWLGHNQLTVFTHLGSQDGLARLPNPMFQKLVTALALDLVDQLEDSVPAEKQTFGGPPQEIELAANLRISRKIFRTEKGAGLFQRLEVGPDPFKSFQLFFGNFSFIHVKNLSAIRVLRLATASSP